MPLRQYWQQENRRDREREAQLRAKRKAADNKRAKCCCAAYPWPHRPGGGLCRWRDPPLECYRRPERTDRPYRRRYAGLRRQIARANGLHPIRDRAAMESLLTHIVSLAKQAKRLAPRAKYRNMVITETGVRVEWQTAGPLM